jgi:hypothetical protein
LVDPDRFTRIITGRRMTDRAPGRWLLFIHQIPPEPAYLRVKTGRRLARLGAVPLKNSVYVLPRTDSAVEDFQWVRRELVQGGGEATVVDAHLVEGLSDADIETLFRDTRDAEYREIASELRVVAKRLPAKLAAPKRAEIAAELTRHERRIEEIAAIDFFGASGREVATGLLTDMKRRIHVDETSPTTGTPTLDQYLKRTWVTRAGIHVDRIASAWLIRRFIDPDARFKFVPPKGYEPHKGELRFDMFEAEFSHEGDACTFEVLCSRLQLGAPGLRAVAEVVHDIDLKDGKYLRPETDGVAALIAGLALVERDDEGRLERGGRLFDQLLAFFARKRS